MRLQDLPPKNDPKGGLARHSEDSDEDGGRYKTVALIITAAISLSVILIAIGVHLARFEIMSSRIDEVEKEIRRINAEGTDYTRQEIKANEVFHADAEKRLRRLEGRDGEEK